MGKISRFVNRVNDFIATALSCKVAGGINAGKPILNTCFFGGRLKIYKLSVIYDFMSKSNPTAGYFQRTAIVRIHLFDELMF